MKLRAEKRIAEAEAAKTDVALLKSFYELMDLADGRGGYEVSEKVIEELFKRDVFSKEDLSDLEKVPRANKDAIVPYRNIALQYSPIFVNCSTTSFFCITNLRPNLPLTLVCSANRGTGKQTSVYSLALSAGHRA